MDTFRFGRRVKLPATIAIKHELRMMMAADLKKAEPDSAVKATEEHSPPECSSRNASLVLGSGFREAGCGMRGP